MSRFRRGIAKTVLCAVQLVSLAALVFGVLPCLAASAEAGPPVKVVVVKSRFVLQVYRGGTLSKEYPVAVGRNPGDKRAEGDCRTPEGEFYVCGVKDSRAWSHDFKDGKGVVQHAYGPWFIRLYTGSDRTKAGRRWVGIGIHGTHDESSMGKRATEGCIRMRNADVDELKKTVSILTPVVIEP